MYPGVTAIRELLLTFAGPARVWIVARLDLDNGLSGTQVNALIDGIWSRMKREAEEIYRVYIVPVIMTFVQAGEGVVNVVLLAPVWMQITHLFMADLLWVVLVLLTAEVIAFGPAKVIRRFDERQLQSRRSPRSFFKLCACQQVVQLCLEQLCLSCIVGRRGVLAGRNEYDAQC